MFVFSCSQPLTDEVQNKADLKSKIDKLTNLPDYAEILKNNGNYQSKDSGISKSLLYDFIQPALDLDIYYLPYPEETSYPRLRWHFDNSVTPPSGCFFIVRFWGYVVRSGFEGWQEFNTNYYVTDLGTEQYSQLFYKDPEQYIYGLSHVFTVNASTNEVSLYAEVWDDRWMYIHGTNY
jgi:hypothetical protein